MRAVFPLYLQTKIPKGFQVLLMFKGPMIVLTKVTDDVSL